MFLYLFIGMIITLLMIYKGDGKIEIGKEDIGMFIFMVLIWPCILFFFITDIF